MKMLVDYVPQLPAESSFKGKVVMPRSFRKTLDDGVQLRNRIVHSGEFTWRPQVVMDLLDAIGDVLYLLDYYAGHRWALGHLSYAVRRELRLEPPRQTQ